MSGERSILVGRASECDVLAELAAAVLEGRSQVLVVTGERGIGKSALLGFLVDHCTGLGLARAAGVESETQLPFAGLHQLCAPFLDHLSSLPAPQQEALALAFGLRQGPPPDRFRVGLAVLTLLSKVAGKRPLLCVVDDVQWLDEVSVQTMEFVARRLTAEHIGMVFALRLPHHDRRCEGLPELAVRPLRPWDAAALLQSVVAGSVPPRIRDRIVAESRGNPQAVLEFCRGASAAELVYWGSEQRLGTPALHRLETDFIRQMHGLPELSRRFLLAMAAEPAADVPLLERAAERLGIATESATAAAEASGLIELGASIAFRHPVMRSAVYQAANPAERRVVHRALAEATDAAQDPDRRAWHRARATVGPDEAVASELEGSVDRAITQGGLAAAAIFLESAASLTPDPRRRILRLLGAAQMKVNAGALDEATAILLDVEECPLDDGLRARIELLRIQGSKAINDGVEAVPALVAAARRLESVEPRLARDAYLDVLASTVFVGRPSAGTQAVQLAESALQMPRPIAPERRDVLLEALALRITQGYLPAAELSMRAARAFATEGLAFNDALHFAGLAAATASSLWDDSTWTELTRRHLEAARDTGALSALPLALNARALSLLFAGELAAASSLVSETRTVLEVTGTDLPPYGELALGAVRGNPERAEPLIQGCLDDGLARGERVCIVVALWARAVLCNGLSRYSEALDAAQAAATDPLTLGPPQWALGELVEAAVHSGELIVAREGMEKLSAMAHASGTHWALGVEASRHAMLSEGVAAETLFRAGIAHLSQTTVHFESARAQLLYGEWLRRQGRPSHARAPLRSAYEAFSGMGADAFAQRAWHELDAAGEKPRNPALGNVTLFTPQEGQIAKFAAKGFTNGEIGAMLFISPRTVEWHLRNVFSKLGVNSRRELRRTLPPLLEREA